MAELELRNDHRKEIIDYFQKQSLVALEKCGLFAEGEAKMNLTKQQAVDTGALRNSITHKVKEENKGGTCHIGTNMEYAPYIEFGTGIHYSGGRRTSWTFKDNKGEWHMTNGQRARPYLKPAIADNIDKYKQIIINTLKG